MIIKGIKQISNIITNEERLALIEKIRASNLSLETQPLYNKSIGNQISFDGDINIYNKLTERLRKETGLRLVKSNAYGRIYKNGSFLKPHIDRDGLDLTLTIQLKNDFKKTPIFAKSYDGSVIEANLQDGDGALIMGRELEHWRNEIKGKKDGELICIFFHWKIVGIEKLEIENFLTSEECDAIINDHNNYTDANVYKDGVNKVDVDYRSNKVAFYDNENGKRVDEKIKALLGDFKLEGLQLLKYDSGNKFGRHHDWYYEGIGDYRRLYTVIIYLNDDMVGGETYFNKVDFKATPKKGMALIWKNQNTDGGLNDLTQHESLPITSGKKFALVQWIHVSNIKNLI